MRMTSAATSSLDASRELALKAGIDGGTGVDLCCCTGAGMRYLLKFHNVVSMTGVDISKGVISTGTARSEADGLNSRISFLCENACETSIDSGSADFVWSEDAWCYVPDKARLIEEAVRIAKPGGKIAFTDWVEGPGLRQDERDFVLTLMNFDNLATLQAYQDMLENAGCKVEVAEDTGLLRGQLALCVSMLLSQYKWDALRLIDFNEDLLDFMAEGLNKVAAMGESGSLQQIRIVATKMG